MCWRIGALSSSLLFVVVCRRSSFVVWSSFVVRRRSSFVVRCRSPFAVRRSFVVRRSSFAVYATIAVDEREWYYCLLCRSRACIRVASSLLKSHAASTSLASVVVRCLGMECFGSIGVPFRAMGRGAWGRKCAMCNEEALRL